MEPYENQKRRNIVQERPAKKPYNGLKNQGATCYLNSILQCLYMTEDFRQEVERFVPDQRNHAKESLMQELQKLFKEMKKGDCKIEGITRMLGITNVYEQEDVVEYYQKTLKAIGQQSSKIFEGKMSNKTKCIKDHIFEEECHFFTIPLSIEVEHNEVFKVHNGLHTFLERIKLDEDNWLYCKQCGQKNETETWNEIKELPKILTLYPKRFYFDYYKMRPVKNHCPMDIPLQLVMSPNLKYELYAVINHIGNERGGHYNAVIKSFEDGKWYCFDDTSVREDSESSFRLSQQAYLLMYRNVEVDRLSPDEKSTNEYYELFTTLLQRIQHFISVFKESKFPSNYKETEILCHEFLDFKKTHLPEIEAYKKHCYKTFEVAVQAGQIKIAPSYHPTNVEKEWCQLQTAIIKRQRLLTKEFKQVYCFHRHLVKQCREFSVPLTQPELDKAKICYIQDLLVCLENKQIQIQNMEWGADLQSNGSHLGITLHQSIIDFKSNIDHAHADETQLTPANRQVYRSYLEKLDMKYKTLLELHKTKKNLKQHCHNFMTNRQDSEPGLFGADECKKADYNNLPHSLEQAEHDESVCKSYITRIKSLRLSLLNYGTYIISSFKQTAFAQDTKEIQTMLGNIKKQIDALIEETLTSVQQSTCSYNFLCWEIDHTLKELEHVYSLFYDYCNTQDTGDVHKKYENQLSDVHKVPANEKEMSSNQELLKKVCSEVKPDASVEDELCDPMLGQLPWLQDYRQRYEQLVQWIADVKQRQENIQDKPVINNKELKEQMAEGKIPTNRQAYRSYLEKLDMQYKTLLELHKTKKNLKQCYHNFMSNRQDSEPGLSNADEYKQADYNNLPQSLEQAEHDVCKSYITQIRSFRLGLENYRSYIISCLKQTAIVQDTSKQKEIQTMLENIKKEFDALIESTSSQQSTWACNPLSWEIDLTAKELEHVYSLFSDYCKAKCFYLKEHSTQDTQDVHKKYENQLSDVLKVHANEKEMASNQELLTVQF